MAGKGGSGVLIGAAVVAAAGGIYLATKKPATSTSGSQPTSSPSPSGQPAVTLAFHGGPSGSIADPQGAALPSLTLLVNNAEAQDVTVNLSVPILPVSGTGTTYTGGRWFVAPGQPGNNTATGQPQVGFTVPAGQVVPVVLGTDWSGNPGTYETAVNWSVGGVAMPQAIDNTTFTITPVAQSTPASIAFSSFNGGPAGDISGTIGTTVEFGAGGSAAQAGPAVSSLVTTWTNSGDQDGTISPVAGYYTQEGNGSLWGANLYCVAINGQAITPTQHPSLTVPGGGQASCSWNAQWTFEAADAGNIYAAKVVW